MRPVSLFIPFLAIALIVPLLPVPTSADVEACNLEATGTLAVGLLGVQEEGVSFTVEDVPAACQGASFTLVGDGVRTTDFDVCFVGGSQSECFETSGDEEGTIPAFSTQAEITLFTGVNAAYTLTAPAGAPPPTPVEPVTDPVQLYFHSGPTGLAQADQFAGGHAMNETPPTKPVPSASHSFWSVDLAASNPESFWNAHWGWSPEGGFNYTDQAINVTWWGVQEHTAFTNAWRAKVFVDGVLVADNGDGTEFPATDPGVGRRYSVEFAPRSFAGDTLVVQVKPVFLLPDGASVILYDGVDHPSGLRIGAATDDTSPPTAPTGLTAVENRAERVLLEWQAASDDVGVAYYDVLRAEGNDTLALLNTSLGLAYEDATVAPSTNYRYAVRAVDGAGNVGPLSDELALTTPAPDATPPTLLSLTFEPGATTLGIDGEADEEVTLIVRYGVTAAVGNDTTSEAAGETVRTFLTGLYPAATYHIEVTPVDLSGNVGTPLTATVSTTTTQRFFLHNVGAAFTESMNELNTTGDNDGRGWNMLGTAAGTLQTHTGVAPIGSIADVYPASGPTNTAVTIDATRNVEATVFVLPITSLPSVGTITRGGVGALSLELSLYANGGALLGSGIATQPVTPSEAWIPFEFSFPALLSSIERGTLRAELHAVAGTAGYALGYEGGHASSIDVPIEPALPLDVVISTPPTVVEDVGATFEAVAIGGSPPYTYAWDFGDAGTASGASATHTYATAGVRTVTVEVEDALGAIATATRTVQVLQRDFASGARVVVAVIDTGINPYHDVYQRPGAVLPAAIVNTPAGTAPSTVDLSGTGDYASRVAADGAAWSGIARGELVHFNNTNALAISFSDNPGHRVRDLNGHGTATSSTVLDNFPNALVVMVQPTIIATATGTGFNGDTLDEAFTWVADQPWIDVVSISIGALGNIPCQVPLGGARPALTQLMTDSGKVVVMSAGNDPSPLPTDCLDGPPWVISVTGSQGEGQAKEIMSSNIYPDYAASYTVSAATPASISGRANIGGTSFSAPTVAGTVAGVVHGVRDALGHTGGISGGELAAGLTPWVVRDALNRTAVQPEWDGYVAGTHWNGDHAHAPGAPFLTSQWGEVTGDVVDPAVAAILAGELGVPEDKLATALWKGLTWEYRRVFWDL